MNKEDIEAALAELKIWADEMDAEGLDVDGNLKHLNTAIKSLRLAHKVMSELDRLKENRKDINVIDGDWFYHPASQLELRLERIYNAAIEELEHE